MKNKRLPARPTVSFSGLRLFVAAASISLCLALSSGGTPADVSAGELDGDLPFPVVSELWLSTPPSPPQSIPTNLTFTQDGRLFYNERCGKVRVVTAAGTLLPDPFATIPNVACNGDYALAGLEFDPDYETNHYVYVMFMQQIVAPPTQTVKPILRRYTDVNNVGTDPVDIGDFPATNPCDGTNCIHAANNIHFGPDGKLYISIGDYGNKLNAQDLSVVMGKMLRVNKEDGLAPPDNPFVNTPGADPRIWAYGFRNSYDFTWREDNGKLYMTENGFTSCDELNIVVAGGNYEWPHGFGDDNKPLGLTCNGGVGIPAVPETIPDTPSSPPPEQVNYYFRFFEFQDGWSNNSTSAPTGLAPIYAEQFPSLGDSLLACEFKTSGGVLRLLRLGGTDLDTVTGEPRVQRSGTGAIGCKVDVAISPLTGDIIYTQLDHLRRLQMDSDNDTPGGCQPGACALEDKFDNCPYTANPGQEDFDADDQGDACDLEDDGDGYPDAAELLIGTGTLDPCGHDGWPSNLHDDPNPPLPTVNKVDIFDITSFLAPERRLDTVQADTLYDARWDLIPGPAGLPPNDINILDLTALFAGLSGFPPMFNFGPAYDKTCPYPA
jgi:hypothetical protein